MKILVVDDDPVTRLLLQASLAGTGHRVQEAADGDAAWHMIRNEAFRLVITDWMMPGIDGIELTRRIRSLDASGYIYIILLTVKGNKTDIVSGLESGADDYLTKPFNPSELRARVAIGERILNLEARLSESRDQMERLATHDSLTGLLNRRAIYEYAASQSQRALRSNTPLSLLMLDVDRFKSVNDLYGHLVGDQALCFVADTISQNKRSYDAAGRWGGEEFMLVLPEAGINEAAAVAERLRRSIAEGPLTAPEGSSFRLGVSVGVSCLMPGDSISLDALIGQADSALYEAKREGRNQVCLFGGVRFTQLPKE